MEKIGITERGDAGIDFSWEKKLDKTAFSIIITKKINDVLIDKLLAHKDKIILHMTCTGMGGTLIEPNVSSPEFTLCKIKELIKRGFPKEQIVLRVDPIIPTAEGIMTARKVLEIFGDVGIKRCRISFLDMYSHVK